MTLRAEIVNLFDAAQEKIDRNRSSRSLVVEEGAPDPQFAAIDDINEATWRAVLLLADRLDALEGN